MDVAMPKLDGYAATALVRAGEQTGQRVPIIMLTAEADVEQRVRGLRAGADDDIVKPFHPLELIARIKALLSRSGGGTPVTRAAIGDGPMGKICCFYGAKGGVGTTTRRDQHRHRARPAAQAIRRADGREPPVRRHARVPGSRPRHRVDRQRGHQARSRHGPAAEAHRQPPQRHRPAPRPAEPGVGRHRRGAAAQRSERAQQRPVAHAADVRLHPDRHGPHARRLQPAPVRRVRRDLPGRHRRPVLAEERALRPARPWSRCATRAPRRSSC